MCAIDSHTNVLVNLIGSQYDVRTHMGGASYAEISNLNIATHLRIQKKKNAPDALYCEPPFMEGGLQILCNYTAALGKG